MADPFSIASGLVGIVGVAIQVTQVVVGFIAQWKDVPKDTNNFMLELLALKTHLSELYTNLVLNPLFAIAFKDQDSTLMSKLGPDAMSMSDAELFLRTYIREMEALAKELQKRARGSHLGYERLKAAFNAVDTQKTIDKLQRYCEILNRMVSIDTALLGAITSTEIRAARNEQKEWQGLEESQRILGWLSQLDFQDRQRYLFSRRYPGTAEWLIKSDNFKSWRDGVNDKPQNLWCPGIPGAGKSVMTEVATHRAYEATVVDHLFSYFDEENVGIAYIFCDYKEKENHSPLNLFSSICKQLVLQLKNMPLEVSRLYHKHKRGQSLPSWDDYLDLLIALSNYFSRTLVLIDALDELSYDENKGPVLQIKVVEELFRLQKHQNGIVGCSLFLTSREHGHIKKQFAHCARIDIIASDSDIRMYVEAQISDSTRFRFADALKMKPESRNDIIRTLADKAQGMFLLPRLHLDRLRNQPTLRKVLEALLHLPTELDETYDDAMLRIQNQVQEYSHLALKVLSWISWALRPLQLDEIHHALAVEPGDQALDREGIEQDDGFLISITAGLVTVDAENGIVRLVHFTVEEYFSRKWQDWFPNAEEQIAETCITYLLFDDFADGYSASDEDLELRLQRYPFLKYAGRYWGVHSRNCSSENVQTLSLNLLHDEPKLVCAMQVRDLLEIKFKGYSQHPYKNCPILWVAATLGLQAILPALVAEGLDVNAKTDDENTALHAVACNGYEEIAKLLIEAKADVNSRNTGKWTPLHTTAHNGQDMVAKLLLKAGADPNGRTDGEETPLHRAALMGEDGVIKVLLEAGADVDAIESRADIGKTALQWASSYGYASAVELLLEAGANVNYQEVDGRTALHSAAWCAGQIAEVEVARLLLNAGADVTIRDVEGKTPLHFAAAESESPEIVKLLLDYGADINAKSSYGCGWTPLHFAVHKSHYAIAKFLIENGATEFKDMV